MKRMSLAALQQGAGTGVNGGTQPRCLRRVGMLILFSSLGWWSCLTATLTACPFCLAPGQTWSEMVAEADVLILAELLSADDGSTGNSPVSRLKVQRIHKGASLLPANGIVTVPEFIFADPGAQILLKASRQDLTVPVLKETFATDDPPASAKTSPIQQVAAKSVVPSPAPEGSAAPLTWDFSEQQSEAVYRYITEAPVPDQLSVSERLLYFVTFLEHPEALVAEDAWGEFANSEYQDIVKIRQSLPVQDLRRWISAKDTSPERLALYGMLLGLCGGESEARFLRHQIGLPVVGEIRFGTDGLMGGLLLLSGDEGLKFLQESRLQNPTTSTFECFPVIQALQFAWTYEPDLLAKEDLRKSLHPLLAREDVREIVIRNLARWEDWSAVSLLPAVYEASHPDDPRTIKAIVGFLIVCERAEIDAQLKLQATQLLNRIREDNRRLVRSVERDLAP